MNRGGLMAVQSLGSMRRRTHTRFGKTRINPVKFVAHDPELPERWCPNRRNSYDILTLTRDE